MLQTTDIHQLVTHIADTLQASLDLPEIVEALGQAGDLHQRQEVLVYYYLLGLMKHIEEIGESRWILCLINILIIIPSSVTYAVLLLFDYFGS